MPVYETYFEWERAVEEVISQAWMAGGGELAYHPGNAALGVDHVLRDEDEDGWEIREARIEVFRRLMDFIWADELHPLNALKRLMVLTRCGSPQHLAGMNQSQVAKLLNETRAATSARELELWQHFIVEQGFFRGSRRPLMKGELAKKNYAASAEGNVNRRGGKRARKRISVLREGVVKGKVKRKKSN